MSLLSTATTETMAKATWEAGGFSHPIGCILSLRERRQELKAGPQRQDRSSNMGPALIINQENVSQTCLQVNLVEAFSHLRFPLSQITPVYVKKQNKTLIIHRKYMV